MRGIRGIDEASHLSLVHGYCCPLPYRRYRRRSHRVVQEGQAQTACEYYTRNIEFVGFMNKEEKVERKFRALLGSSLEEVPKVGCMLPLF